MHPSMKGGSSQWVIGWEVVRLLSFTVGLLCFSEAPEA